MQLEIAHAPGLTGSEHLLRPLINASAPEAPDLDAFKAHLEKTGKICPKPWCWKRFYMLFKPAGEPPWLSSWWLTSTQEKKVLFLKQVEYLAWHTDHFHAACRFLHELDNEYWLISGNN